MPDQGAAGYERRDINPKWLTLTALIIIVSIALCLWLASAVLDFGRPALLSSPPGPIPETVPTPHLRANPKQDLADYQQGKRQRLHQGGVIDRNVGIAHIPIEQALEHIAEHGLPRWDAPADDSPAMRAQRARDKAGEKP